MPRPPLPRTAAPSTSEPAHRSTSRRAFLAAAGGAAAAAIPALVPAGLLPLAAAQQARDRSFAAFAASAELVLAAVYEAVLPLLSQDLVPLAETHLGHHRQHAEAFAELAGDDATGEPDPALLAAIAPALEELSGVGASLRFARDLEQQAVATYVAALATLEQADVIALVATVVPVDAAHVVTLGDLVDDGLDAAFPTGAFEPTDPALGLQATAAGP